MSRKHFAEDTQISRSKPALPTRRLAKAGLFLWEGEDRMLHILHHGAGKDEESSELMRFYNHPDGRRTFNNVVSYDPYVQYINDRKRLQRDYDIVVSNYVLNVLPPAERQSAMLDIRRATAGVAYITVRGAGDRSIKGTPYADGVMTSKQTFQKGFTVSELVDELKTLGDFETVEVLWGTDKSASITVACYPRHES